MSYTKAWLEKDINAIVYLYLRWEITAGLGDTWTLEDIWNSKFPIPTAIIDSLSSIPHPDYPPGAPYTFRCRDLNVNVSSYGYSETNLANTDEVRFSNDQLIVADHQWKEFFLRPSSELLIENAGVSKGLIILKLLAPSLWSCRWS